MRPNIQDIKRMYNLTDEQAERVLSLYDYSCRNQYGFCIMGRRTDIDSIVGRRQINNICGRLALEDGTSNFFFTDENQNGNVLSSQNWTIAMNDAWVLGGIDSQSIFNFAYGSEIYTENDIREFITRCIRSNNENYPHTVTARELWGLREAGYIPHIEFGTIYFTPGDCVNFNIQQYYSALNYEHMDSNDETMMERIEEEIFQYLKSGFNH